MEEKVRQNGNQAAAVMADFASDKAMSDLLGYEVFDTTKAYSANDIVLKGGKLYKFTASKPAGEWDDSKASVTTIKDIIG